MKNKIIKELLELCYFGIITAVIYLICRGTPTWECILCYFLGIAAFGIYRILFR